MENLKDSQYYKFYIAGYRDGVADALAGKVQSHTTNDPSKIPVAVMGLSARARNCLIRSGCNTIADVLALEECAIRTMHSLGQKTACEIAQWLAEHYYFSSAWVQYL